jgi:hypothetical protein
LPLTQTAKQTILRPAGTTLHLVRDSAAPLELQIA